MNRHSTFLIPFRTHMPHQYLRQSSLNFPDTLQDSKLIVVSVTRDRQILSNNLM